MKGWTLETLREKGVSFTVVGGAPAPSQAETTKRPGKKREPLKAPRNRPAVAEIVVDLPVPPSANHCWANVQPIGRVRSGDYRRWHKSAATEASLSKGRIDGRFTILIELGDIGAHADVDNRTKPTLDLLAGLLTDDDSLCTDARAKWADDVKPRRMRVTLRRAA